MGLTVAVTGPTGDIGKSVVRALEREAEVERIIGMARRPFDPAEHGWERAEYRQGDILDRDSLDALLTGADVVVHLAFVIFGGHDETREVNLQGTRNVFEAAVATGAKRLVYTSSVAAYGFPEAEGRLTEAVEPRGTDRFYYSAQKAELEAVLSDATAGSDAETYVFRPCVVAGRDAPTIIQKLVETFRLGGRLSSIGRLLGSIPGVAPVIPDPGLPFQLVHHDDVADALAAAVGGPRGAGALQPGRRRHADAGRPRARAGLALGADSEAQRRRRGRGDRPRADAARGDGVDQRLPHAGADGLHQGAHRARLAAAPFLSRNPGGDRRRGPRGGPALTRAVTA